MPVDREKYLLGEVILIDKDYKWTSFDVIKKIRNTIRVKKVGHAGTLDPLATGLLIICTGRKTKDIHHFQDLPKEYTGALYLGATRPSHDKETPVTETSSLEGITKEKILNIAGTFHGKMQQRPPSYSAIRKEGKRLYELARQGEKIIADPREVEVYEFEIVNVNIPLVTFRLKCSKGFYVRSLARDFGQGLGCGAYLENLRRTAIGEYRIEMAETIEEFVQNMIE